MNLIKSLFEETLNGLQQLDKLLRETPALSAHIGQVPPVEKGHENVPIDVINPKQLSGFDAMVLAGTAYQDLYLKPPYSGKSARRYVGMVHLSPSHPNTADIVRLVHRTNELKSEIERAVVANNETRQQRFNAIHENCPGVMTIHLYRQIHCLEQRDVRSLRLTWQQRASLHRPDKAELLKKLAEQLEYATSEAELPLNQLIRKVASCPEHALRIRREVKVQPIANVVMASGPKTLTAPLPIIVVQEAAIKTKPIPSFVAGVKRKKRSDKTQPDILGTFAGQQIERVITS